MQKDKKHVCTSICPSLEYLSKSEIVTNVTCTVPGCDEVFSQLSALSFHLEKVHRQIQKNDKDELLLTRAMSKSQKESENCDCKYFCPIEACKFSLNGKRSLPTFHSLKNHFIRIHGCKKFKCSKCFKQFSIKSEMERHETSCGKMFKCQKCDIGYSTLSALHKHEKIKNHTSPSINPITNKIPIAKNSFQKPSNQIFILPNNSLNSYVLLPINLSSNECAQRSFACQTSSEFSSLENRTQETACQTQAGIDQLEQFESLSPQFNPSLELLDDFGYQINKACMQSTSTSTCIEQNSGNNDYDCLDAATSTSPFIDFEMFLNNTSTQTQQSFFVSNYDNSQILNGFKSQSIQTHEESLNPIESESENYFSEVEIRNMQEYYAGPKTNRCITPSSSNICTFAASQTDDLYFYNTNSIQTQTYDYNNSKDDDLINSSNSNNNNYNVVETQTEWDFIMP